MSNTLFSLQVSPSLPAGSAASRRSRPQLLVQLVSRHRATVSKARPRAVARRRQQPAAVPAQRGPEHSRQRGRESRVHARVRGGGRGVRPLSRESSRAAGRVRARRPDRVLLRRVRLARELPDLLGRSRRARRRSLQDRQRSRACRSSAWACCIGRAISISASIATASSYRSIPRSSRATRRCVLAVGADGQEVRVTCPGPERTINVRVWRAPIGRVTVLLLDTDVPENAPEDRNITYRLYGGDEDLRVQQEAVLGVAGVRALRALNLAPTVWHINEGHAAFSVIERLREHTTGGVPFAAALEAVMASTVFTTHTPVSAGHDRFPRRPRGAAVPEFPRRARRSGREAARARPRARPGATAST